MNNGEVLRMHGWLINVGILEISKEYVHVSQCVGT